MNNDTFLRYVEEKRTCEESRLDAAVSRGLFKAKNDSYDRNKFFLLAAASVFSFALCLLVNSIPAKNISENYYQNQHKNMTDSSEIINGYMIDITVNIKKYLGGE